MLIALKPQSITRFMISFLESQKGGSDKHKPTLLALKLIVLLKPVNENIIYGCTVTISMILQILVKYYLYAEMLKI
jgi:hypothetical protein